MLSELTASSTRLALIGLAKNTGKTVALAALLHELQSAHVALGVTSVGRDGEERDVIDARIAKPAVRLGAGALVASTQALLQASGLALETLEDTGVRTPLGRVLIARLQEAGAVEVAGPSAAGDVRLVADAMLAHGAERILIDGAIDRRAASSPRVADGLVLCTGAVLDREIDQLIAQTSDAVELIRLPLLSGAGEEAARLRELASEGEGLFVDDELGAHPLPERFFLAEASFVEGVLAQASSPRWLIAPGALPKAFLDALVPFVRRSGRSLRILVGDPTKVFLWKRGPSFYERRAIHMQALERVPLRALTVNPLAPQSHRFDSAELRAQLADAISNVPILDVLHPDYAGWVAVEQSAALPATYY